MRDEHKERESGFDLSLRDLADLVENASEGLHCAAADGTILWANRAELSMLGYERDEYVGKNLSLFHVDERVLEEILGQLARGETIKNFPARLRKKDGSVRHVLIDSSALFDDAGRFAHSRCFTRDVTDLVELVAVREAAARRAERLLAVTSVLADALSQEQVMSAVVDETAEVLGAVTGGLWLISNDGDAELYREVGYSEQGRRDFRRLAINGSPATPVTDTIRNSAPVFIESFAAFRERYSELATRLPARPEYATASLPIVVDGRCIGALAFTFDTVHAFYADERAYLLVLARHSAQALERAQLFDSERAARHNAELATQAREDMLAIVSHDLRNPLGVVSMKASLLLSKLASNAPYDQVRHDVRIIIRNAERMEHLIGDLLDYSAIDAGRLKLKSEPHAISTLVARAAEAFGALPGSRRLRFEINGCGDVEVVCDRERTLRVFANLIGNAIKFTKDEGEIVVSARRRGDEVCFEVKDDGIGLSPEQAAHVFERHWQARRGTKPGLGLGLFIARAFVEAQGGTIWAESGAGGGSIFGFTLPVQVSKHQSKSARILVVEDDEDLRAELTSLLEENGYSVAVAADGRAALEYLQAHNAPSLVLLDLMMPVMNGWELHQTMKTDPKLAGIPVVVVSCVDDGWRAISGIDAFLQKPVSTMRLLDLAEHYCS